MTVIILTEKPDASQRIAEALAEKGTLKKHTDENNVSYYEFERKKKKHLVLCAVGHLFNLSPVKNKNSGGWSYPIFDSEWKPSFIVRKESQFSKKYYDVLEKMIKNGSEYIVATDYDIEGAVIAWNVMKFLANQKDGRRMKFSTLTKDELIDSYENMSKHLDFPQVEAGLTRHFLDWLWGINTTRALTLALKNSSEKGGFAILSSGRVQGPTLSMLMEKELEIRKFKPTPFWQLVLSVLIKGKIINCLHEKEKFWKKEEADKIFTSSKGKDAVVKGVEKKEYKQSPPVPFNTTDLQAEAYAQFKFSPRQTLSIAESLYQAGYISYPRSSSQKLPPSINYQKILKALASLSSYEKLAPEILSKKELKPNEGKKEDPAHPAVYPTWETPDLKKLMAQQKKLYDIIVKRFLAVFADDALRESMNVKLDVNGNIFNLVGKRTINPGWTKFYAPYTATEELILPEMKPGDKIKVKKFDMLSKQTEPPGRYSQGSILKELEKRNLGTKATRAEILQTLYDRKYIVGKSIQVTKLGEAVVKVLKDYSPEILSEDLTRHFEKEMDDVYNEKKKKEEIIEEAKGTLEKILKDFKKHEKDIGKKLLEALQVSREDERTLGSCLNCKTGQMKVFFSRFTKKRFAGCSNYFRCAKCGFTRTACKCKCEICGGVKGKCKCAWKDKKWLPSCQTGFPLPAVGMITSMNKQCEVCGWPMIQVWRKGSRPFRMCINHLCKSKEDWGKNKNKRVRKKVSVQAKEKK